MDLRSNRRDADVYLVDLFDYLDYTHLDTGPGQITLKETLFYEAIKNGYEPPIMTLVEKAEKLYSMLVEADARLRGKSREAPEQIPEGSESVQKATESADRPVGDGPRMTIAKAKRDHRRQLGQFITPPALAERVQNELRLSQDSIVLEPSFGDGSFLIPVMRRLVDLNDGDVSLVLREHLFGCEIEQDLFDACVARIVEEFGITEGEVRSGNLYCDDFFRREQVWRDSGQRFDTIIGNPPFGGTFDPDIVDQLDSWFGRRNGDKVKKETYSFFILACVELLTTGGTLRFICSDTFVTIKTMRGLREYLSRTGSVTVENLDHFSEEVHYDLVVLGFTEGEPPNFVTGQWRSRWPRVDRSDRK